MNRRVLLSVAVVVLIVVALIGCGGKKAVGSDGEPAPAFPNSVGSYWVYEAVDSVRQVTDTITVSIVGKQVLPGITDTASTWVTEPYNRWLGVQAVTIHVISTPTALDTVEVDTVKLYEWKPGRVPWLRTFYVLPFEPGRYWTEHGIRSIWDSTHVMQPSDAQTPLGLFKNASYLVQKYSCGDECVGSYKYWFVDGVGIVKSLRVEEDMMDLIDGPELIAGWELIEYHVVR